MFSRRFIVSFALLLTISLDLNGCRSEETEVIIDIEPQPEEKILEVDEKGTTIGVFIDEVVLDPLGFLLEYLKNLLQKILIHLDQLVGRIFSALASILKGLINLLLAIPLALIDILSDLLPGLIGNMGDELKKKVYECHDAYPVDPINDTLFELKDCVTDPLYYIVEDLSAVATDLQKVLLILDGGIKKIENFERIDGVFEGFVDILKGIVAEALEILTDLVAGPISDLLIVIPELIGCILGSLGKTFVGQILELVTGYVKCLGEMV